MNLRNTYILFAAVIVVLIGFVVFLSFGSRGDNEDFLFAELRGKAKGEDLTEVKNSIDKVEIERLSPPGKPMTFVHEGTRWVLKDPYIATVDATLMKRLIDTLVDARVDRKAQVPSKDQAGLDPPSAAVTLISSGKSYRVMFGQISLGSGGKVFAATGDKPNRVLVLRRTSIEDLLRPGSDNAVTVGEAVRGVTDFRPAALLADDTGTAHQTVQRVVLAEGKKEVVLQKDNAGGWQFQKPDNFGYADPEGMPDGPVATTIAGVNPLIRALSMLRMPPADDVIEDANLAQYGLELGKEEFRIELGRQDGGTDVLRVGKKADPAGAKVYAAVGHERLVVKIDAKSLEPIRKIVENPKALRNRDLTNIPPPSVDAIDIKTAEGKIELRKLGMPPQWRLFEGTDAYENGNHTTITKLLDELTARRNIRDFPESMDDKAMGLDQPAAVIDLWVGGIIHPEPKKDEKPEEKKPEPIKRPSLRGEPALRLTFGKKDKDIVYVRRSAGIVSSVVAVPESLLTLATKPQTAYLDLILPSFDRQRITKLSFTRGATKYELDKPGGDPGAAGWTVAQPPDLAGRTGDPTKIDQIITALQTLAADSVLARKATAAEIERYGLKTPRSEATVVLKDEKEPKVYQFGGEADDKAHFYFRLGGTDRVYLVPKATLDPLLTGEVIDPTIWRVDAAKIKGVKITGWKSLTGGMPLTLDLVRKSQSEWSVKDQADYAVDVTKAEPFANALALVRTDHFVKSKGGAAPEHKLDVKDDALVVEVTVDGEKEPFVLTIGGETKENNIDYYFASSNKMPGAVFLVFRERFAEIRKSGRGYFQKAK